MKTITASYLYLAVFIIPLFLLSSLVVDGQEVLQVIIVQPINGTVFEGEQIKIDYFVSGAEPKSARILVDDRPVQLLTEEEVKTGQNEVMVDVPPRDCKISIIAQNELGVSVPAVVHLKRSAYIFKPTLYVLAIGISKYNNPNLRLQFAAKDAIDFSQTMLRQQGLLYEKVELRLLTDGAAVAENIRSGLQWLQNETTYRDVAMLYMAGHGENNNIGNFFFMPVYGDLDRLNATCVSGREIKETIDANAGKMLVFMDACHSGNVLGNSQRAAMFNQAISELTGADNGAVVFSSSTGRQFSLENTDWNNGAFTKALVEGLSGKADLFDNKTVTVKSLDLYITRRVKELTNGQQAPTTTIPNSVPDFPLAVVATTALPQMTPISPISIASAEPAKTADLDNSSSTVSAEFAAKGAKTATAAPAVVMLTAKKGAVYDRFGVIPKAEVRRLMENTEASYLYNMAIKRKYRGNTWLGIGGGIMALGVLAYTGTTYDNAEEKKEAGKICLAVIGIGCAPAILGIALKSKSKKFLEQSVDMYNNKLTSSSTGIELQFGFSGNGVGLALHF